MIHTFYRLGRLYAASPLLVLLALACASAVVGLSLTIPWILKGVLDYGLAQRQVRFLYLAGALLVVVTVVRGVVAYGQSYLTAHLAQRRPDWRRDAAGDGLARLAPAGPGARQSAVFSGRDSGHWPGAPSSASVG